jgi:hypothetical protein
VSPGARPRTDYVTPTFFRPMPPKPLFRQPGAKHFQLVHRSQRDPLINDSDASRHVLKPFTRENTKKVLFILSPFFFGPHLLARENLEPISKKFYHLRIFPVVREKLVKLPCTASILMIQNMITCNIYAPLESRRMALKAFWSKYRPHQDQRLQLKQKGNNS